jgi:glycosyltransferase involved in cell wall biosynthesis
MPVFNEERYLQASIDSVLSSTYQDYELIIIDDGSTDSTASVLKALALTDNRISIHSNMRNLGIARSSNIGLRMCRGEFIALMDADDLCMPKRFEKQISYLDSHVNVQLVGSAMFNLEGNRLASKREVKTQDLASLILKENPLYNPTVMFRRELLDLGFIHYSTRFRYTQDYRLWARIAPRVNMANINEPLLAYRADKPASSSNSSKSPMRREIEVIVLRSIYLIKLLFIGELRPIHLRYYVAALIKGSLPAILRIVQFKLGKIRVSG